MLRVSGAMAVALSLGLGLGLGWILRMAVDTADQHNGLVDSDVPEEYAFLYEEPSYYDPEDARGRIPIDSIILERSIYAPGLNYRVVLSREGESRYEVRSFGVSSPFAARRGTYVSQIDVRDFAALALVAERLGFSDIEQRDRPYDSHSYAVTVTLAGRGGRVHRSALWEDLPELWALAEAIDGVVQKMPWREPPVER